MKLKPDDEIVLDGAVYRVVSSYSKGDSYWVTELYSPYWGYPSQYLWSQEFINKEIAQGRMVIRSAKDKQTNCWHDFEQRPVFRFYHDICKKCGYDKGEVDWKSIKRT